MYNYMYYENALLEWISPYQFCRVIARIISSLGLNVMLTIAIFKMDKLSR